MGLRYARGSLTMRQGKPASAFSQGDILQLNSASSLSRIAPTWPSGADIVGVAMADSIDSINNYVAYAAPETDTVWWASADTALTSNLTPGLELDIAFSTANGRYYVTTSTNSVRAVVVEGDVELGDIHSSVESKVLIKLISHAGNIDLS